MLEYLLARFIFLILCVWKASRASYCYYSYYYCYSYYDYSSDTSVNGGAIVGIVIGVIAFAGIASALIFFFVCKKCPGKTPFRRSIWGNRVTVVSCNNTVPVQNTTMFPQQQAYPPTMMNNGIGQGSTFQYGQLPQQYGVPPLSSIQTSDPHPHLSTPPCSDKNRSHPRNSFLMIYAGLISAIISKSSFRRF